MERDATRFGGLRGRLSLTVSMAVMTTVVLVGDAFAQVDCSDPDNLCTGDPCIISDDIDVLSPCVVDFSPRALVIDRIVRVPNGGTLQFTAGSIAVNHKILGRHITATEGNGANVSLIASGNITVGPGFGQIDVTALNNNGTISLTAGGNVDLQRKLQAKVRGAGATATGGTVTIDAAGTISTSRRARIDARGRTLGVPTPGGSVTLNGDGGVTIRARVTTAGSPGGTVTIDSVSGDVVLDEKGEVDGNGQGPVPSAGGTITVTASGAVSLTETVLAIFQPTLHAKGGGGGPGGSVVVQGNTLTDAVLRANAAGQGATGGSVQVDCASDVDIRRVDVGAKTGGGSVDVDAGGSAVIDRIFADSQSGPGGTVSVKAAGDVTITEIQGDGDTTGGCVFVSSTGGNVLVEKKVDLDGGTAGGEMSFSAAAGNLTIGDNDNRDFIASGPAGGTIQGDASGNLTAAGTFDATVGGCIGLSAGGTLDTAQATFSPAPGASCPLSCPSPSGAFLDVVSNVLE